LGINDRTTTILELKKFITNKNLILQLEEKCSSVNVITQGFFSRLEPLTSKGFPSIFVINDKLIPIEGYVRKLTEVKTSATTISNIRGTTTPRLVLSALYGTFFILNEIKHIFLLKPTFTKYTKMDAVYQMVTKLSIPYHKRWE